MTQNQTESLSKHKPFYTLFIGNTDYKTFDNQQREEIFRLVCDRFPSFTALDAQGYYKGKPLPTIQIHIATKDRYSLSLLCQELGLILGQKSIGLVEGGVFHQVEMVVSDDKKKNRMLIKRDFVMT